MQITVTCGENANAKKCKFDIFDFENDSRNGDICRNLVIPIWNWTLFQAWHG